MNGFKHPCAETCSGYKQAAEEATLAQSQEIARLRERVGKLREGLEKVREACLCDRFKTNGFDYGETHRRLGKPKTGARWLTPRDLIVVALDFSTDPGPRVLALNELVRAAEEVEAKFQAYIAMVNSGVRPMDPMVATEFVISRSTLKTALAKWKAGG